MAKISTHLEPNSMGDEPSSKGSHFKNNVKSSINVRASNEESSTQQ